MWGFMPSAWLNSHNGQPKLFSYRGSNTWQKRLREAQEPWSPEGCVWQSWGPCLCKSPYLGRQRGQGLFLPLHGLLVVPGSLLPALVWVSPRTWLTMANLTISPARGYRSVLPCCPEAPSFPAQWTQLSFFLDAFGQWRLLSSMQDE